MPKTRRDLITVDGRKLRLRLLAAIVDIPEIRDKKLTTALAWLAHYALDILYRGRSQTLPWLIAKKFYDKRFEWGRLEGDPKRAMKILAGEARMEAEEIWLLMEGASPTEEQLASLAQAFKMELAEVVAIAEGRGPKIDAETKTKVEVF